MEDFEKILFLQAYIKDLNREIKKIKSKNKDLENKVGDLKIKNEKLLQENQKFLKCTSEEKVVIKKDEIYKRIMERVYRYQKKNKHLSKTNGELISKIVQLQKTK